MAGAADLPGAFILPAETCLSLSNSITSLLRFWLKTFPPSLFQVYFQRGDLEQSDLAETAFEGLVRPIMSFFHVPGPRPKKRPGTMLVHHPCPSCPFLHFSLLVPSEGHFVAHCRREEDSWRCPVRRSFRGTVCRFRRSGSLAQVGHKLTGRTPERRCGVHKVAGESRRTPKKCYGVQEVPGASGRAPKRCCGVREVIGSGGRTPKRCCGVREGAGVCGCASGRVFRNAAKRQ